MESKKIRLVKKVNVPDRNGATNFGGIDTDGKKIYAVKTNQAENITTLYEFSELSGKKMKCYKFADLGHANGLAYYNGSLYVPMWGAKHNHKSICRIDLKEHKKHIINGGFSVSNLAHLDGNLFITRTATSKDKKIQTFAVIEIANGTYKIKRRFYVNNPKVKEGFVTNQDIYYKNGYLYIMMVTSNVKKSCVLISKVDDCKSGHTYFCNKALISGADSKFEIESMCAYKGKRLFGMNTNSDGIYVIGG